MEVFRVFVCVISPRQDPHKVAGAGGMEEGLNVPQLALKRLKLRPPADAQNLLDVHPTASTGTRV